MAGRAVAPRAAGRIGSHRTARARTEAPRAPGRGTSTHQRPATCLRPARAPAAEGLRRREGRLVLTAGPRSVCPAAPAPQARTAPFTFGGARSPYCRPPVAPAPPLAELKTSRPPSACSSPAILQVGKQGLGSCRVGGVFLGHASCLTHCGAARVRER